MFNDNEMKIYSTYIISCLQYKIAQSLIDIKMDFKIFTHRVLSLILTDIFV